MMNNLMTFSGGGLYAPLQKRGDAFWRGLIYWTRYILLALSTCLYNQQAQQVLSVEHGRRLKKKLSYVPQIAKALYKQVDKTLSNIRIQLADWLLKSHQTEERQDILTIKLLTQMPTHPNSKLYLERLMRIVAFAKKAFQYKAAQLQNQLTTDRNILQYTYTIAPLSITGVI